MAFRGYEADVRGVPLDDEGMRVDVLASLLAGGLRPKFVYTIPDYQNPTGLSLSAERRPALVDLARRYGFLILERSAFPPSARWRREKPSLSGRSRSPRAPDTSRTPRRQLDRDDAKAIDDRPGEIALSMPVLSNRLTQAELQPNLVTQ